VFGFGRDAQGGRRWCAPDGTPSGGSDVASGPTGSAGPRAGAARGHERGGSCPDRCRRPADRGGRHATATVSASAEVAWPAWDHLGGLWQPAHPERRAAPPHHGIDAACRRTPVGDGDGVVSLANPTYFTGGTDDRPWPRLHSIYAPADVLSNPDRMCARRSSEVGRPAAPPAHLHWGVYWFGHAVDPAPWSGPSDRLVKPSL
jgi:hypothetical protein